jgi:hypothetical protein
MNISLSTYERQLVTDQQALLAKNAIIQKVYRFFGELSEAYNEEIIDKIPGYKNLINPKISRGENYLGLPYVILDFPRQFGKPDIFAIRSLFWWGNFFSITLHLSGYYQQHFNPQIQHAINNNIFSDWFIANTENQWDHHFEQNNYIPLKVFNSGIAELPFLKMAKKIPLTEWDNADSFFIENFSLLIKLLATHAPIL